MDEQRIIELYRRYDSCREVADELGTYDEAIRRVLVKHGISRTGNRPKKQPRSNKRMPSNCRSTYCGALVVMLRENLGLPTGAIRDATGIPTNSVVNILNRKRPDLKLARCQRVTDKVMNDMAREYIEMVPIAEIGEKYDICPQSVSKLMSKRGLTRGRGVSRENMRRHVLAVKRFENEYDGAETKQGRHKYRRLLRINSRPRDLGITWKALAKKNGSLKCEICGIECDPHDKRWGSSGPTHPSVDHVVEICNGGTDTWDNVRLTCCACNISRNKAVCHVA